MIKFYFLGMPGDRRLKGSLFNFFFFFRKTMIKHPSRTRPIKTLGQSFDIRNLNELLPNKIGNNSEVANSHS